MKKRLAAVSGSAMVGTVLLAAVVALLTGCGQRVETASSQGLEPALFTFQSGVVTNTNGTVMDVTRIGKMGVQVEGIVDATVTFQASIDEDTWYAVEAVNRNSGAKGSTATADGVFDISVGEFAVLRSPVSSWVSGTITVLAIGKDGGVASPADVVLGAAADPTYIGDINFGESLPAGSNTIGDVTVSAFNETDDITVTLDSEIVAVDATGQGDVPISTSRDLTVTLDSETVTVDATGSGDVPITLDSEAIVLGAGSAAIGSLVTSTNQVGLVGGMAYNGSAWQNLHANSSTYALEIMDHSDAEIHNGNGYEVSGRVDITNGGTYDILVTVSAATECSMLFEVDAEAECSYILYENPTLTGGTVVTAFNRNRTSVNTAATEIYHTPTVTTTGTAIRTRHWGDGKASGGMNRGGWETILAQSEDYLLRITNETTSDNYVNFILRWHEN